MLLQRWRRSRTTGPDDETAGCPTRDLTRVNYVIGIFTPAGESVYRSLTRRLGRRRTSANQRGPRKTLSDSNLARNLWHASTLVCRWSDIRCSDLYRTARSASLDAVSRRNGRTGMRPSGFRGLPVQSLRQRPPPNDPGPSLHRAQ